jgi:phospholipid/cholesterol/gamma-HCH transport system substrate-binding protein
MSDMVRKAPQLARVIAIALVAALVVLGVYLLMGGGTKKGTAYFKMANSINEGDSVNILGIEVGKVDTITPMGDRVKIDFHYDSKYKLPADVKAAILSPTLVATRFMQLDPAYTTGPEFADGGEIPLERTAVPVEFDELKKQLDQISEHFGPNGVNKDGAVNRVLTAINKNGVQDGVGQGQAFHEMVVELSKAAKTLSDGRGDLFGTIDNLAHFAAVLNKYDKQIVDFQAALGDVSKTLDDNSKELEELLPTIDAAGKDVEAFVQHHGKDLTTTIDRAGSVSRAVAKVRDALAQTLHIAPNTLANFTNLFHPRTGQLYGAVHVSYQNSLASPGNQVCALITSATAANEMTAQRQCAEALGPVFAALIKASPLDFQATPLLPNIPLVPGLVVPHGSTPHYGDFDHRPGQPDTESTPNAGRSDIPRSNVADKTDRSYTDNFPIPNATANPIIPGGK